MGKFDIEALEKRIEALEARVGRTGVGPAPVLPYLVDYSNDLGNSVAGNDRIGPLMKRLEELETYLDPLYGEKETCSAGVKMSLLETQFTALKGNQELLGRCRRLLMVADRFDLISTLLFRATGEIEARIGDW